MVGPADQEPLQVSSVILRQAGKRLLPDRTKVRRENLWGLFFLWMGDFPTAQWDSSRLRPASFPSILSMPVSFQDGQE